MLSIHGLVIIAEEVQTEVKYPYITILKFEVASDSSDGKTIRHYLTLFTPNDKAAETKERIKPGVICEIAYGTLIELISKNTQDEPASRRYSKVELKVKLENFKFLKPCVYYEGIPDITAKVGE